MTIRFASVVGLVSLFDLTAFAQQCFPDKASFVNYCTTTYNGIVNGGRCFFLASTPGKLFVTSDWVDGFTLCKNQNGTFAQIHTSSEFIAAGVYFNSVIKNAVHGCWVAAARDTGINTGTGWLNNQRTRWYDNASYSNPLLTAGNTYMRKRSGDDVMDTGNYCTDWWGNMKSFGDYLCTTWPMVPVCTVYNKIQDFALVVNKCMTETIIETYTTASSTNDCATYCASRIWCRSYNYYPATLKCDLFTWHHSDTSNMANVAGCYHYAYIP